MIDWADQASSGPTPPTNAGQTSASYPLRHESSPAEVVWLPQAMSPDVGRVLNPVRLSADGATVPPAAGVTDDLALRGHLRPCGIGAWSQPCRRGEQHAARHQTSSGNDRVIGSPTSFDLWSTTSSAPQGAVVLPDPGAQQRSITRAELLERHAIPYGAGKARYIDYR